MAQDSAFLGLEVGLPAEVLATLRRAAEIQGRALVVVTAAHEAACRTIAETDLLQVAIEDQRQLADGILNPPAPADALKRAFRRRHAALGS